MTSEQRREMAEELQEELKVCSVCSVREVPHWCENCQRDINRLESALSEAYQRGQVEGEQKGLREAADLADGLASTLRRLATGYEYDDLALYANNRAEALEDVTVTLRDRAAKLEDNR